MRDTFLLRLDPKIMALIKQWSADDLRSINGQIEFLLRQALLQSGRLAKSEAAAQATTPSRPDKPE